MKRLLIQVITVLALPTAVNSSHINSEKQLLVTSESTRESIEFARYLKDNGVVKGILVPKLS